VKIKTTRFGQIDINESELIVMKGPILGFEHLRRFVLLIHDRSTPLCWLQSVEDPSTAFVVINPRIIRPDYNPPIVEGDVEFLDIKKNEEIALLAIVTVRSQPFRVTANIRAPILINAENRMARQIVLDDPGYPIQYNVIDHKADVNKGVSLTGGGWTKTTGRLAQQTIV